MRLSSSFTVLLRTVLPASWLALLPVVALVHVPDEIQPARWFMRVGHSARRIPGSWRSFGAGQAERSAGSDDGGANGRRAVIVRTSPVAGS